MSRCTFTGLRPRLRRLPLLFFALVSLCCAAGGFRTLAAQTAANWTIEGVLSMMDKSAQDFHTLTTDIQHIKYTPVGKETSAPTRPPFLPPPTKNPPHFHKP